MTPTSSLSCVAVALLCMAPLASQQVLTVGPGQTYSTINAAITAAAPGDTVLVIGGSYLENLDVDKPLQIVGQGALLRTSFLPPIKVRIHDLGANDRVVFRGFTLQTLSGYLMGVTVERCAGPVVLHDLENQGGAERWSLGVVDSPQVHAARCLFYAVGATGSGVFLERCVLEPTSWNPGLNMVSSVGSLVACTVNGSIPGIPAVWLDGGSVLTATLSQFTPGGFGSVPGIQSFASDLVLVDSSTQVGSLGGAPAVVGTVPVVLDYASLRAQSDGATLTTSAHGPAGELFVTVFSGLAPTVATPFGATWLDLASFGTLYAAVFDPLTRTHLATIAHPPIPAGTAFALQTLGLGPDGIRLGVPTVLSMP